MSCLLARCASKNPRPRENRKRIARGSRVWPTRAACQNGRHHHRRHDQTLGSTTSADGDDSLTTREGAQFKQRCAHASGCVQPHHARRGCGFRDLRRRIHQSTKSCSYESRNARSPKLRTGGLTDNARRSTTAKACDMKNGLQCLCCGAVCLRLLNLWSEALTAICSAAFGTKLRY